MVGTYMRYNGYPVIIVAMLERNRVRILHKENRLQVVNLRSLAPTSYKPAQRKYFDGEDYLVTAHDTIISLKTGKFCKPKYSQQILQLSGIEQAKEVLRNTQMSLAL